MSETLFRFFVNEITSLRIVCKNPACGSSLEIPLGRLHDKFGVIKCPVCDNVVQRAGDDFLARLADVLLKLQKADYADVGFSLKSPPPPCE